MTGGDAPVSVNGLTHDYGSRRAVDDLSFELQRGEMFGLIGPDGAGKTTTLRNILGLLKPSSGRLVTCGLDPQREARALSSHVGYLSQRFSLYGDLTVDENLAFFAEIHGERAWRQRADELLTLLRLDPFRDRLAERLSGGMKQKLALCCTLIHRPELLVLDEPTTGVDPVSRRDFWRILSRLQREGLTILVTTPYLDEAERCRRVALIEGGRLLEMDTPDALRARYGGVLVELIAQPKRQAAQWLEAQPGAEVVQTFGERLHASFPNQRREQSTALLDQLRAGLTHEGLVIHDLRAVEPSLEDVFIARLRPADAPRPEAGQ